MPVAATGSCHDQGHLRALQCLLACGCLDQIVTTPDFANVSMRSCRMGAPYLAEWMKPRLAVWRCAVGKYEDRRV
jgi:hypothetical protein